MYVGMLETEPRPTLLSELREAGITCHEVLAQERGVTPEKRPMGTSAAEPGPVVSVDPGQMMQVLNNLVGNAIRHAREGGKVILSTGRQEAEGCVWARVSVSDTGERIPTEAPPRIFEPLFREEEPRSARVSEAGLRLMIVKGIVELLA